MGQITVSSGPERRRLWNDEERLEILNEAFVPGALPETDATLALMEVIDATFLDCPWYGSRKMTRHLKRIGHDIGHCRARWLMAKMGLTPIYQWPRTSDPHPQHRIYSYLLRKLAIEKPNHVWCASPYAASVSAGRNLAKFGLSRTFGAVQSITRARRRTFERAIDRFSLKPALFQRVVPASLSLK